jgi:hypothetical protein
MKMTERVNKKSLEELETPKKSKSKKNRKRMRKQKDLIKESEKWISKYRMNGGKTTRETRKINGY